MAEGSEKMTSFELGATFTDEKLQEIVQRIVEVADPLKIVLFGSAARGDMSRDSDADFLVIVKPGVQRLELAQRIHKNLRRIGQPIDIIVVTTEDVETYGDFPALIIYPALKEGRVVYAA